MRVLYFKLFPLSTLQFLLVLEITDVVEFLTCIIKKLADLLSIKLCVK